MGKYRYYRHIGIYENDTFSKKMRIVTNFFLVAMFGSLLYDIWITEYVFGPAWIMSVIGVCVGNIINFKLHKNIAHHGLREAQVGLLSTHLGYI